MNSIVLMGRIVRDPEINAAGNTQVSKTCVAVYRSKEETDFVNITGFGKVASFMADYLKKGTLVCLSGSLRISSYENKEGRKVNATEVFVDHIEFAGSKQE